MSAEEVAIHVKNVSKTFRLPHERKTSIKSAFINLFRKSTYEQQQALKDISFEVKKGEFFGIVGRNGSGKSTLLKLLANIYAADQGSITVNGKLTPFIELGVGFNPELTGKENVFLNGALLGFNRKEVAEMYEEIVDFAELHKFMDQKLKNYSSGMQVRLAFSIAVKSKSDILLFDEVLAVGDSSFQQKCFDIFAQYKASDKTIVLVTHDMGSVREFCDRAMLITDSKVSAIGKPSVIAAQYDKINQKVTDIETEKQNQIISNKSNITATITDENDNKLVSFKSGAMMRVRLEWPSSMNVKNAGVAIIKDTGEYVFGSNTFVKGVENPSGGTDFIYEVKMNVGGGRYRIMAGVFGETQKEEIDFLTNGPSFLVTKEPDSKWEGLVYLDHKWYRKGGKKNV